jgi:caffeoyl-CoA O-methyltransferase
VRVGDARALLAQTVDDGEERLVDLTFIDANKGATRSIWSGPCGSRGPVRSSFDNAIRGGSVPDPEDESGRVTHEFDEQIAKDLRLSALVLPLIRGRVDGLAIARVVGP